MSFQVLASFLVSQAPLMYDSKKMTLAFALLSQQTTADCWADL